MARIFDPTSAFQAGIIRHVMNEQDFRDEQKLYRFRVDEEGQRSEGLPVLAGRSTLVGSDAGGDASSAPETPGGYREPLSRPRSRLVDLRPLVLAGHGRDARTTAALHGLTLPAGVHLLPVYLTLAQLDSLLEMAETLRAGREADIVDILGLRASVLGASATENVAPANGVEVTPGVSTPTLDAALDLDVFMAQLGLTPFQAWLFERGWSTAEVVREKLQTTPPSALVRLASTYTADNTSIFTDALVSAREVVRGEAAAKAAKAAKAAPSPSGECERVQLELYLQGLGSTVLVIVLSPSHAQDQELLTSLSAEVSEGLAALEESLTAHSDSLGGTESQRTVDEYNFVTFDGETHGIAGWCNTDRSVRDQTFLPDTDDDRAFVKAVTEMHATFLVPDAPDVMEIQLRKNYHAAV